MKNLTEKLGGMKILSREEMKKVSGGEVPNCQIGTVVVTCCTNPQPPYGSCSNCMVQCGEDYLDCLDAWPVRCAI